MNQKRSKSRRSFLKATAGTVAAALMQQPRVFASPSDTAPLKDINPDISNLRVVCCYDQQMATGTPTTWNTIADQNKFVAVDRVQKNIDAMAMALAQKKTPLEAWQTIFQKKPEKQWSEVMVAIKANCKTRSGIPKNNPRLAVLDKICKALNQLGVPFSNIIIYDGDDEDASVLYKSFIGNGLPAGIVVSRKSDSLGGTQMTPVPAPWNKNVLCTKDLANGTIDILVNCTVNKGSHDWTGPASLSMKNHLGTFTPVHDFNFVVGINKSQAIIGGTPPRQQLCIVDSIWACTTGPSDPPNKAPYRLVMGTCSPVVDYLTIKKIREQLMGAKHTAGIVSRYLSDFGYSPGDVSDFVNIEPTDIGFNDHGGRIGKKDLVTLSVTIPHTRQKIIHTPLNRGTLPVFIFIHDIRGRYIRSLPVSQASSGGITAAWNGTDASGTQVSAGTYLVSIMQNGREQSHAVHVL